MSSSQHSDVENKFVTVHQTVNVDERSTLTYNRANWLSFIHYN